MFASVDNVQSFGISYHSTDRGGGEYRNLMIVMNNKTEITSNKRCYNNQKLSIFDVLLGFQYTHQVFSCVHMAKICVYANFAYMQILHT